MLVVARLRDDPTFPRPIYFGRRRRWRLAEIEKYERAQIGKTPSPYKAA